MGFRLTSAVLLALVVAGPTSAFLPHSVVKTTTTTTARSFGVDPSVFQDLPQHIQHLPDAFSSISLSDAMDGLADAADVAEEVAKSDSGWFGFLTEPISILLQLIHQGLMGVGMSENSWGISIIGLTVLIKVVTFPLTKTQLESTNKMQVRIALCVCLVCIVCLSI